MVIAFISDFLDQSMLTVSRFQGEIIISYREEGREPDDHILEEIFPFLSEFGALDLSTNKVLGYIGGSTTSKGKKLACLGAFAFNKSLSLEGKVSFPPGMCS